MLPKICDKMDGSQLAKYHAAARRGPAAEFQAFGRVRRNPAGGPTELNAKMLTMIRLMVFGREGDAERKPLDIFEAAATVGYRKKAARRLAESKVFMDGLHEACAKAGTPIER